MDTFLVPPLIAFPFCTRLLVIRDTVPSFFCLCATVALIFNTLALSFLPVQILIILLRPGSNVSLAISSSLIRVFFIPLAKFFIECLLCARCIFSEGFHGSSGGGKFITFATAVTFGHWYCISFSGELVWSPLLEYSGEGNGNPLQYSCLENPMDRGAWRATVHRVAKSRTWLNNFTHQNISSWRAGCLLYGWVLSHFSRVWLFEIPWTVVC